jgi:hypothetical protein
MHFIFIDQNETFYQSHSIILIKKQKHEMKLVKTQKHGMTLIKIFILINENEIY